MEKSDIKDQVIELAGQEYTVDQIHQQLNGEIETSKIEEIIEETDKNKNLEDSKPNAIEPEPDDSSNVTGRERSLKDRNPVGSRESVAETQLRGRKRRIFKDFNRMFRELRSESEGAEWNQGWLKEFYEGLDKLQDRVEEVLQFEENAYKANALWKYLEMYRNKFEAMLFDDPDFAVTLNFKYDELHLIDYILSIDRFNTDYDQVPEWVGQMCSYIIELKQYDETRLDIEQVDQLIDLAKSLNKYSGVLNISDKIGTELEQLSKTEFELEKTKAAIQASIWGIRKLDLPEELYSALNECLEKHEIK
ncbi:MAG: hypothetical protein AAF363_18345 [Bacteroidota bacterium]